MRIKYDLLILLAGENEQTFPRSKKAIEIYEKGNIGDILISGSAGGFRPTPTSPEVGSHIEIANFLNRNGIHGQNIYTDWRPVDTLGNFAFLYAAPLPGNPDPNDLETAFLTEWGHMNRTKQCAEKVFSLSDVDYFQSPGEYGNEGVLNRAITAAYHEGLMRQTVNIKADPKKALDFLEDKHPFYQVGWLERSVPRRKMEIMKTIVKWNLV